MIKNQIKKIAIASSLLSVCTSQGFAADKISEVDVQICIISTPIGGVGCVDFYRNRSEPKIKEPKEPGEPTEPKEPHIPHIPHNPRFSDWNKISPVIQSENNTGEQ